MEFVPLTQNKVAVIDDEDFVKVSAHQWHATSSGYAGTRLWLDGRCIEMLLHRFILSAQPGCSVDHINGDRLDCRRANLRLATNTQNARNQRKCLSKTTSRFKGVAWHAKARKWQVGICIAGKRHHLGLFSNEITAAQVYDTSARKFFGEFARLNFGNDTGATTAVADKWSAELICHHYSPQECQCLRPSRSVRITRRFWRKVQQREANECWLWQGAVSRSGYGTCKIARHTQSAHRMAYMLANRLKDIEPGLFICHRCDNRLCVNPTHLFLGTAADNIADRVRKGRSARGEKHPNAKLTQTQVEEIRSKYIAGEYTQKQLAAIYRVSESCINGAVKGKRYSSVIYGKRSFSKYNLYDRRNENNPRAKLTWKQVREGRDKRANESASVATLARCYGVAWATMRDILNGRCWKENVE